jgi:hypothetical protein
MLREWLRPHSLVEFAEKYLGRAPYARPGAAASALPQPSWDVLDRVLRATPAPDVLVARDGRLAAVAAPTTRARARQLLDLELAIVVRKAEQHDAGLAELARSFALDVPGEVHVLPREPAIAARRTLRQRRAGAPLSSDRPGRGG